MQDTEFYAALLSLGLGWRVRQVRLDMAKKRVDVWVETTEGGMWQCSACGKAAAIYDHADEQTWRHLDTCQCRTYVHARLPRTACKEHGVRQVAAPWAGPRSGFTLLMECRLIDTLKECDVTGCCRLMAVSWDEGWGIVERAVRRGRARKPLRVPEYLGIEAHRGPKGVTSSHFTNDLTKNNKTGTKKPWHGLYGSTWEAGGITSPRADTTARRYFWTIMTGSTQAPFWRTARNDL